ncbi:TetR family transcriptional regulator [Kribbella amoyensis]|uniref:TetR family transcriptional regulator n=1 Tax=Kribbella amoyensis TaxID=996641 RepID=A0A561BPI6_9ACTN|nr:TetR/AcrR family transcriptional regulator [Kribbella amoyensis]TWD80790.1 TetR family transcriptional regulator [Kribbella amoyensis]
MTGEHHGRRGAHILEAVQDVIAERGLEAATMRTVAAAANISLAQVQYYFRSKDELVAAAFQYVTERFDEKLATIDLAGPPRKVLRSALELWLPLDEDRARDARVWLAFSAAAATSPALQQIAAATDAELRIAFARLLDAAVADGDLAEVDDTETEAAVLLAVLDGLVIQGLTLPGAERPAFLTRSLDAHLGRLFR